ncbi:hypothetical protein P153DRAFT_124609 [Dothidotthia symphoricarpi CBS 119687]|uniref:Uncharacterized protein n=1 Tax=Dothidotthia symphoricarpi CBS 119687 TaxID=1392245 RepID=A0A6A6A0L3_9PLEO|nr:uncharacterized protein P153DRAFT_124609 [Dothidotthia symphoricarpi CBS 119687]KAF2124684.1 hypothetical protein P153DRAFT_124609 [Dothidotthia symphoricarpi CBS 119687]
MTRRLPARGSKIIAAANMAALVQQSSIHPDDSRRLIVKIPKRIWNAWDPRKTIKAKTAPKRRIDFVRDRDSPTLPAHCKAKLWRFHYGGPAMRVAGKWQNKITYETPCLQTSCVNCQKWHPHLLDMSNFPEGNGVVRATAVEIECNRPTISPLSPEVERRMLDDYATDFTPDVSIPASDIISSGKLNIVLSSSPVNQAVSAASPYTRWRSEQRQRNTVRLKFTSFEGQKRFRTLVGERERKEKKLEKRRHHRFSRTKSQGRADGDGRSGTGTSDDGRWKQGHRVRLMFRSQEGRDAYRRLVDMY